jgi:hypothetical protein
VGFVTNITAHSIGIRIPRRSKLTESVYVCYRKIILTFFLVRSLKSNQLEYFVHIKVYESSLRVLATAKATEKDPNQPKEGFVHWGKGKSPQDIILLCQEWVATVLPFLFDTAMQSNRWGKVSVHLKAKPKKTIQVSRRAQ